MNIRKVQPVKKESDSKEEGGRRKKKMVGEGRRREGGKGRDWNGERRDTLYGAREAAGGRRRELRRIPGGTLGHTVSTRIAQAGGPVVPSIVGGHQLLVLAAAGGWLASAAVRHVETRAGRGPCVATCVSRVPLCTCVLSCIHWPKCPSAPRTHGPDATRSITAGGFRRWAWPRRRATGWPGGEPFSCP